MAARRPPRRRRRACALPRAGRRWRRHAACARGAREEPPPLERCYAGAPLGSAAPLPAATAASCVDIAVTVMKYMFDKKDGRRRLPPPPVNAWPGASDARQAPVLPRRALRDESARAARRVRLPPPRRHQDFSRYDTRTPARCRRLRMFLDKICAPYFRAPREAVAMLQMPLLASA